MSLALAADSYVNACRCGADAGGLGNCAHYASEALAKAGFAITAPAAPINARCAAKMPIRAHELRNWIAAQGFAAHAARPPLGTAAFFHCLKNSNGTGHVGFISTTGADCDTGTGSGWGDVHTFYY